MTWTDYLTFMIAQEELNGAEAVPTMSGSDAARRMMALDEADNRVRSINMAM